MTISSLNFNSDSDSPSESISASTSSGSSVITNLRKIRSFVRREGRLTTSQERALKDLYPVYGVNLENQNCIYDSPGRRISPKEIETKNINIQK